MKVFSWHPAAKTNAIYLDGTETPETLDTSWIKAGSDIAVFLHSEAGPRSAMWAGAKERLEQGGDALDLTAYAEILEQIVPEFVRRSLRVKHIAHGLEQYGDAQGLYQVETGDGWSGPTQTGLFEAAGLGPVSGYRDPAKLDQQIEYSRVATLALKAQLDSVIHPIFFDRFGTDITITNYNWGDFDRPKDGLPMPNVQWGSVSNPATYGPQRLGDRFDEFKSRLIQASKSGDVVVWIAASTYYQVRDTFEAFVSLAREVGVEAIFFGTQQNIAMRLSQPLHWPTWNMLRGVEQ